MSQDFFECVKCGHPYGPDDERHEYIDGYVCQGCYEGMAEDQEERQRENGPAIPYYELPRLSINKGESYATS